MPLNNFVCLTCKKELLWVPVHKVSVVWGPDADGMMVLYVDGDSSDGFEFDNTPENLRKLGIMQA